MRIGIRFQIGGSQDASQCYTSRVMDAYGWAGTVAAQNGTVVNLPNAPAGLNPSLARYKVGQSIDIEVDLGNERPTMASLLRYIQQEGL